MSEIDTILDRELRERDPDRWLSSRFVADPQARARLVALYALDGEWTRVAGAVSTPLAGEIRLAWWRDALESFADGGAPEHPALKALGRGAATDLQPLLLAAIEARHAELEGDGASEAADIALMAAAARLLDPETDPHMIQDAARAWYWARRDRLLALQALAAARMTLRALSPAAFPAAAHAALARAYAGSRQVGDMEKRLRVTWAVLTGGV